MCNKTFSKCSAFHIIVAKHVKVGNCSFVCNNCTTKYTSISRSKNWKLQHTNVMKPITSLYSRQYAHWPWETIQTKIVSHPNYTVTNESPYSYCMVLANPTPASVNVHAANSRTVEAEAEKGHLFFLTYCTSYYSIVWHWHTEQSLWGGV